MITDRGASEKAEGSLDTLLAKSRDIADGKTSGLTAGASGVVNGGLHVLADAAKWAGGEVAQLGGAVAGFLGQLDHTTIGGRNNNPLNTRPVGKSGFVHFTRPEDGLEAAGVKSCGTVIDMVPSLFTIYMTVLLARMARGIGMPQLRIITILKAMLGK